MERGGAFGLDLKRAVLGESLASWKTIQAVP